MQPERNAKWKHKRWADRPIEDTISHMDLIFNLINKVHLPLRFQFKNIYF